MNMNMARIANKLKINEVNDYKIYNIMVNEDELWSGYHKDYTPFNGNSKNLIFKIVDKCKNVEIIGNNYSNFFPIKIKLEDMYLVYKFE